MLIRGSVGGHHIVIWVLAALVTLALLIGAFFGVRGLAHRFWP